MINVKSAAVAVVLSLGFAGAATAQVVPGVAGTPGRGSSNPVALMPNGAPMSNGYQAEPSRADRFYRGSVRPVVGRPAPAGRGGPNFLAE